MSKKESSQMEPNKVIKFSILCNEEKYLEQIIKWYNSTYKTDFRLLQMIYDEVNFAEIQVTKFKLSDLFDLGYQLGVKEEKLRQKGEIDN
jgi:hypothetical protein